MFGIMLQKFFSQGYGDLFGLKDFAPEFAELINFFFGSHGQRFVFFDDSNVDGLAPER